MKNTIEITGINLHEFAKKVYELSMPQGLGFLHFQEGGLDDDFVKKLFPIVENNRIALDLDYVKGRACKMIVFKENDKLYIRDSWYDHTNTQLQLLLEHFNIKLNQTIEHGIACNCSDCQYTRRI